MQWVWARTSETPINPPAFSYYFPKAPMWWIPGGSDASSTVLAHRQMPLFFWTAPPMPASQYCSSYYPETAEWGSSTLPSLPPGSKSQSQRTKSVSGQTCCSKTAKTAAGTASAFLSAAAYFLTPSGNPLIHNNR